MVIDTMPSQRLAKVVKVVNDGCYCELIINN
jgi:hypothetical protein